MALTVGVALLALTFDLFCRKIPNLITLPAIGLALILHSIESGGLGFVFSVLGLLLGIAFLFIPYALGGMGAGDVKLLGAIGALQGPTMVVLVFLYTALVGGVMVAVIFWRRRAATRKPILNFRGVWVNLVSLVLTQRPSVDSLVPEEIKGVQMPYAVAIGIGTLLALFVGRPEWL